MYSESKWCLWWDSFFATPTWLCCGCGWCKLRIIFGKGWCRIIDWKEAWWSCELYGTEWLSYELWVVSCGWCKLRIIFSKFITYLLAFQIANLSKLCPVLQALDNQVGFGVVDSFDAISTEKLLKKQCIIQGNWIWIVH